MPTQEFPLSTTRSRWTPLCAILPPLLLLGLGMALGHAPQPSQDTPTAPEEQAAVPLADGFVPQAETMVVTPRQAAGYSVLRGRLKPVVNAVGESPLSAQVARVAVRPGQQVRYGDAILDLSTSITTRSSRRAESSEKVAEANQVAAARKQELLQAKMREAQERLIKARARVAAAQERIASVRAMVLNLRRGGPATEDAAPRNPPAPAVKRPAPAANAGMSEKEQARLATLRRDALREAQKAQRAADQAASQAVAARRGADSAVKTLDIKKQNARVASETVAKTQTLFDEGKAKGSDVESARAAAEDADAEVKESITKSATALQEAQQLERVAADARSQAQKATNRATQSLQQLQVFARSTPDESTASASTEAQAERDVAAKPVSVADAQRLARAAVAESETAIKSAEDIEREISGYRRQVNSTRQRLEHTSSNLENAQHQVLDTNIRQGLSSVRAPASGTILWVADVADQVARGEAIVAVVQPGVWQVRLADSSGVWKSLKPGMQLPALVQRRAAGLAQPASLPAAAPLSGTPTQARLDAIIPPAHPNAPALLRVVVANAERARGDAGRFRSGMVLLCSVSRPGSRTTISIPEAATLTDANGNRRVAVLTPVRPEELPQSEIDNPVANLHRIEWRQVGVGNGDGIQREIVSGLFPGERIALQPETMRALTMARGASATVRLGNVS